MCPVFCRILFLLCLMPGAWGIEFHVSPEGSDAAGGTAEAPFATVQRAQVAVRALPGDRPEPVTVYLHEGVHTLGDTVIFGPEDSGALESPVTYAAFPGDDVLVSGGRVVTGTWEPFEGGIYQCRLEGSFPAFNQLFVNGTRQHRARFPNYDAADPLRTGTGYRIATGGTNQRPDERLLFDPETFTKKRWLHPETGILHGFQTHNWGNLQYRITSVGWENNAILLGEGGFQLQRTAGVGKGSPFYVENIFEELDSPGEWFLDAEDNMLYYLPPEGVDLATARIEAGILESAFAFRGSYERPVRHVRIEGLRIGRTRATFMDNYEPIARGDWAIHRGGAIYFEGAEDCALADCDFDAVGGNGVFVNAYNRRVTVTGCRFTDAGESGVCFVGLPEAVRHYETWDTMDAWEENRANMDLSAGPKTGDYPRQCVVSNNIMQGLGVYGKQTAGVFISMASEITVSHNTIHDVPRAAICINDGTWGGHIVEHNDLWETIQETGDHGPFNSWGRERQWRSGSGDLAMVKEYALLDAIRPTKIRHNRIANSRQSLSAGSWNIDLDDGSTNYEIYNNLCLGSTLKLREGYYRKVWNNIFVSAIPLGWHVWPKESGDVFVRNIVVNAGAPPGKDQPLLDFLKPARMPEHPWGKAMDYNLYWNVNTKSFLLDGNDWEAWHALGYDAHSLVADPKFIDPAHGDFRVQEDSPALLLGFENFAMDQFGHTQTRMNPRDGEFEETIAVTLEPDARGGKVFYTLDGSEPTPSSNRYTGPVILGESAELRARTFNNGVPVGFEARGVFTKVARRDVPSWLETLLAGSWQGAANEDAPEPRTPWRGAEAMDIRDGGLVSALGGQNTGAYLVSVPENSGAYALGFREDDVVTSCGGAPINNVAEFLDADARPRSEALSVDVLRGNIPVTVLLPAN